MVRNGHHEAGAVWAAVDVEAPDVVLCGIVCAVHPLRTSDVWHRIIWGKFPVDEVGGRCHLDVVDAVYGSERIPRLALSIEVECWAGQWEI